MEVININKIAQQDKVCTDKHIQIFIPTRILIYRNMNAYIFLVILQCDLIHGNYTIYTLILAWLNSETLIKHSPDMTYFIRLFRCYCFFLGCVISFSEDLCSQSYVCGYWIHDLLRKVKSGQLSASKNL